jgi:invasion protein IalB
MKTHSQAIVLLLALIACSTSELRAQAPAGAAAAQAPIQVAQAVRPQQAPAAPAAPAQPQLLGQYGDWGAYTASPGGRKICFIIAKPANAQTTPPNRPRNPVYFFITSRPAENVRNEVSTVVGYTLKPNSDATAEVGGATFTMYTQNDGAWIKNVAEEARMVDAMRKGADLVIKGVSGRGTQTTDTYSLKGLAQALDRIAQECR